MASAALDALFAWLPALEPRARRRRRLRAAPWPAGWEEILRKEAGFRRRLPEAERRRARPLIQAFLGEQRMVGAQGLVLDEEVKLLIAASAVRPVLHLGLEHDDHIREIVVHPYERLPPPGEGPDALGLAHAHGIIVLCWPAVLAGLRAAGDGHDTALHEFVHALDLADGVFDGAPALRRSKDLGPWARTLAARFDALRRGEDSPLRDDAAHSSPEFFAVASERFLERPEALRRKVPDLYAELRRFYGWDPGRR